MESTSEINTSEPIPIKGAYEIYDGKREELITLTRAGRLLQEGELLPPIPGISPEGVFIIHTVNAFGTPTCDECTSELETFHQQHPGVPVYSLTKQTPEQIQEENAKHPGQEVTHNQLSIDDGTAIDLGVALRPGEGADEEFWPTALRRMVAVVKDGQVVHIQEHDDQEEKPDFMKVFETVESLSN